MTASRRRLLVAAGAGAALGAAGKGAQAAGNPDNLPPNQPEWSRTLGPGVIEEAYGTRSRHETAARRYVPWLTQDRQSSVSFTPLAEMNGIITPSGLHFERHHGGVPDIDPSDYRLMIHGMVERPLVFTLEDLKRLPSVSRIHFLECPANGGMEWRGAQMSGVQYTHGMLSCSEWTGVPLKVLLAAAGLRPGASWVLAEGGDASHLARSIPLRKLLDDAFIAFGQNGEAVRPQQGYPARLVLPGYEGNMWIKWIRRIEVGDRPWFTRWETRTYADLMPDGLSRQFTFVNEVNSCITNPCPEKSLRGRPGFVEISGLAWSGAGRIARVDVSVDGGDTWRTAELQEPVLSKAVTRFRIPWEWQEGRQAFLQSRAMDEAGRVQPTLDTLRRVRGVESIYHKNSIHTWLVDRDGTVANVQID
ncbi:sulfite dehydrogenase [Falsiroseomonas bella]|uniref:Sulfite dehydrogenase n=2 Tax=Falsiroseomonas bella TaxID=2184016 RepID=A0A317FGK1_9PROT|nr:sulfite dehydrogenase [Falsiroseomonas bella]